MEDLASTTPPSAANEVVHTPDEYEDADFRQVVQPVRTLILPENSTRGGCIEFLSNSIPTNEYGLPVYYLRSDRLDVDNMLLVGCVNQDEVDAAAEALSYTDGFPQQASSAPFWTQLPHEARPTYILFQEFLDLAEMEGIRLLDTLATQQNIPLETLANYSKEFYWSARARAYDLFLVAAESKKREIRTRKAENLHYDMAGKILDKAVDRFNKEPDLIDKMEPKELFDLMEQMVKIQRLSLGLTGQNASSTNKDLAAPGAAVEMVFRNLTKNVGLGEQSQGALQSRLKLLMADPETAMQAQELIIRATAGG